MYNVLIWYLLWYFLEIPYKANKHFSSTTSHITTHHVWFCQLYFTSHVCLICDNNCNICNNYFTPSCVRLILAIHLFVFHLFFFTFFESSFRHILDFLFDWFSGKCSIWVVAFHRTRRTDERTSCCEKHVTFKCILTAFLIYF